MTVAWWDVALIGAAAYIAGALLIRFMLVRRDAVIAELGRQIEEQLAGSQEKDGKETAARREPPETSEGQAA